MSEATVLDRSGYTVKKLTASDFPPASMPALRQTRTYVEMEVSKASYDEIKYLLTQAGYDHCFLNGGGIDLHGIAVTRGTR